MPAPAPPHGSKAGDSFVQGLFWVVVIVGLVIFLLHTGSGMH
jgi:hypothetical protein